MVVEFFPTDKKFYLKKHGRKEKSFFRYGLDLIHNALAMLVTTVRPIMQLVKLLKPPTDELVRFNKPLVIGRRIF